ncbi:cytochrome c oxidase assembly protein [Gracilibacillus kekensis]|uniref:Putative membrane protein n=1 Tax=Gracilibacillus kekensis TaxID=1027249 RepID=A0A1M7QHC0_9BACI|nr:cytochrome c oxidase assembly protein [Gracilibacillus kekensis]SHN30430.1 putative membrane protein [Gracilibacillus kekensis]
MHHQVHNNVFGIGSQVILMMPFLAGVLIYLLAIFYSYHKQRKWSIFRSICWVTGSLIAILAVIGPLAEQAHNNFTIHMLVHLFLGMLAPLLMVLAAPMTLFLRALSVKQAKRLTRLLRSMPFRVITDPTVASILNIGGLWILYTTNLFALMHEHLFIYLFIHVHIFLAGYVFTLSMIYIDPTPHRTSYIYRSIILILSLAGHGILAKFIYANPPAGVAATEAEKGSLLMYYSGDAVDIVIIFVLCLQWYRETRPNTYPFATQKGIYLLF